MEQKKEPGRAAFIRIAQGAEANGWIIKNNTAVGDADFIDNQGNMTDVVLEGNKHITPAESVSSKKWWKKPETVFGLASLSVALVSIPWWPQWWLMIKSLVAR